MSITKKALMIGIGSTIAVGGITTAIAVPLSQRQTETEKLPVSIPSTVLKPATTIETSLQKLTANSIVIKSKSEAENTFDKKENYAFNIEASQLSLKEEDKKTFPSWTTFEFKINQNQNKVVDLNKGILVVELAAKANDKVVRTTTFKIEGFKTVSEQDSKLVTTTNDKVTLDLSKVETNAYRSIETLNKLSPVTSTLRSKGAETPANQKQESGLTTLLHKLTLEEETQKPNPKEWNIEGEVKLGKLSSKEDKTNFHLVSATNNKYLKLINTKQGVNEEIIVDEIVVTNLLASNISIKPVGINTEENKAFVNEFGSQSDFGYKAIEGSKKVQLKVKKNTDQMVVSTLLVNPYLIEKKEKNQEIKANLLVSFGMGETIKTYDLSVEEQLNELKTAGFGFDVYVKKLSDLTDKFIKAEKITMGSDLESYFAANNFTIPIAITTLQMSGTSPNMPKGGFTKVELKPDALANEFKLGTAEKVQPQNPPKLDTPQETLLNENWVAFASYSYKGMMNKVLLTPTIDVIHLEVKQPTTTGPVVDDTGTR